MDSLVNEFNKLSVLDVKNKVANTFDIDELNQLVEKLSLSENLGSEEKRSILYWVFCQTETINNNLYNKEKLNVCTVH